MHCDMQGAAESGGGELDDGGGDFCFVSDNTGAESGIRLRWNDPSDWGMYRLYIGVTSLKISEVPHFPESPMPCVPFLQHAWLFLVLILCSD